MGKNETISNSDIGLAINCLCGKYAIDNSRPTNLRGLVGGMNLGLRPMMGINAFCPTVYRIEDDFFGLYARHSCNEFKYAGQSKIADEIPVAMHKKIKHGTDFLVSSYVFELKSAIVELYLSYRAMGSIPLIENRRFIMQKVDEFWTEEILMHIEEGSALERIQEAARLCVDKDLPPVLSGELEKILRIRIEDSLVPENELEKIFENFVREKIMLRNLMALPASEKEKVRNVLAYNTRK